MIGAVSSLLRGAKLLTTPALRPFILIPLVINIVLFSAAFMFGYWYIGRWIALHLELVPSGLHWLMWLIYPLFFVSFCIGGFFAFSLLANLIAAPFYAKLAEKTLEVIDAPRLSTIEPSVWQVWRAEFKRFRYTLLCMFPLSILFSIPIANLIAPLLWLNFSAWCIALEYFAYPQENRGVLFPEQQAQLKTMKLDALSFGSIVALGQSLPVINIVIAPIAVIAATSHLEARTTQN